MMGSLIITALVVGYGAFVFWLITPMIDDMTDEERVAFHQALQRIINQWP